jgi:hypothetical protein
MTVKLQPARGHQARSSQAAHRDVLGMQIYDLLIKPIQTRGNLNYI